MSVMPAAPKSDKVGEIAYPWNKWTKSGPAHRRTGGKLVYLDLRPPGKASPATSSDRDNQVPWRGASPAYAHARHELERLMSQQAACGLPAPTSRAVEKTRVYLRSVLAEDSVFPTMSIDEDGGVIAEWRFYEYSLEIDVDPDGHPSFTLRENGIASMRGTSTTPLRKLIRDVSTLVALKNPGWRSLFPNAHTHQAW